MWATRRKGAVCAFFGVHARAGVYERAARESVQMRCRRLKQRVCRNTHLSTLWDVGGTRSPAHKHQVIQTKQLVIM